MARIDHHGGRATADFETNRIQGAMRAWQVHYGTWIDYFRFDRARTTWDDVYDEVTGAGRAYQTPIRLACQHVTFFVGPQEYDNAGGYYSNAIRATVSYEIYSKSGMPLTDIDTGLYQFDRIVYKDKVYRVTNLQTEGQIQDRETIVTLDANQLRADELVEDVLFHDFSERPIP